MFLCFSGRQSDHALRQPAEALGWCTSKLNSVPSCTAHASAPFPTPLLCVKASLYYWYMFQTERIKRRNHEYRTFFFLRMSIRGGGSKEGSGGNWSPYAKVTWPAVTANGEVQRYVVNVALPLMPLLPDKMAEGCCCPNKCIVVRNCPTLLPHVHTGPNTTKLTSANISHSPHQALSSPCGLTTWTKHDRLYGKILLSNIITYSMPARSPVSSCNHHHHHRAGKIAFSRVSART